MSRAVAAPIILLTLLFSFSHGQGPERISKPGVYRGYTDPLYSRWKRISKYVSVRDGTKLAVDIYRPVTGEKLVEDPLPVVWTYERYHRATPVKDTLSTRLEKDSWLTQLIRHGYVVCVVDVRGTGASFGRWRGPFTTEESRDGYDVTEWFAAQPWCNKRVGMFGRSYSGINQYLIAAEKPPHLKAIFPEMAMFDLYSFTYAGGVFHQDFATRWERLVRNLDTVTLAAPVDDDKDGKLLARAVKEHQDNANVHELFASLPYRDSTDPRTNRIYETSSPSRFLPAINRSGIAIYHLAGWFDLWPRDALIWYGNLQNPQKLIVGPWSHRSNLNFSLAEEHLRWYDYWLKGIENGIMSEAPIHFRTMGATEGQAWRSAKKWPLPEVKPTNYYFHSSSAGDPVRQRESRLDTEKPLSTTDLDTFQIDYSASSGTATRWTNGYGGPYGYLNMSSNDAKGLSYTSPPLTSDTEITGHPVAHLWITSKADDVDLFVYLEEVLENGNSQYVTEGVLKASHRATSDPRVNYLGLPYHRGYFSDLQKLAGTPVELVVDLLPTSSLFRAGNRFRVTITGADKDNYLTQVMSPPPVFNVLTNTGYTSYMTLPIVPASTNLGGAANIQPGALPETTTMAHPVFYLLIGVLMFALPMVYFKFSRRISGK